MLESVAAVGALLMFMALVTMRTSGQRVNDEGPKHEIRAVSKNTMSLPYSHRQEFNNVSVNSRRSERLNHKFHTYVVHVPKFPDRKLRLQREINIANNFGNVTWVSNFLAENLAREQILQNFSFHLHKTSTHPILASIWYHHIYIWEQTLRQQEDWSLVLEDDVEFKYGVTSFRTRLLDGLQRVPQNDWDITFPGTCANAEHSLLAANLTLKSALRKTIDAGGAGILLFNTFPLSDSGKTRRREPVRCTHGYTLSKRGAQKLLTLWHHRFNSLSDLPVDNWMDQAILASAREPSTEAPVRVFWFEPALLCQRGHGKFRVNGTGDFTTAAKCGWK